MAKINDMTMTGKSGSKYRFAVYARSTDFKALGAIYVQSKRTPKQDGGGNHAILYIGQTSDLSGRPLNHHKKDCFDRRGSNCVSVFLETTEKRRLEIEADLVAAYDPPCNG